MARIGIGPHVIEKVLNHQSGVISGVAAVYNRHGYEAEKREAIEQWAEHVELSTFSDLASLFIAGHVRKLRRARQVERLIKRELVPVWGAQRVETLTGRDVAILVADVAERAPVLANRVLSTTRRLFGWAMGKD